MNPQAISFLAALGLAVAAGLWRVAAQSEPETTKNPSTKAPAVEVLSASPPVIPPFTAFYVNQLNPFVPYQQRMQQVEKMQHPVEVKPPAPIAVKEPPKEVHRDPLVLPKLARARDAVPQCVGLVAARRGDARAIMVRMDAGEPSVAVQVGEEVAGWRLDAIDGPTVRWTAPTGESRTFLVAPASRNAVEIVPRAAPVPDAATPQQPASPATAPQGDGAKADGGPAGPTAAPAAPTAKTAPATGATTSRDPGVANDPLPAQPAAEPAQTPAPAQAPAPAPSGEAAPPPAK